MEIHENLVSEEQETKPQYDTIIVFGRGIAKDTSGKWHPTPYFEKPAEGQHSGVFKTDVKPQSEKSVVAGANANVLATYHLYRELAEKGQPPNLVIFAAGRPPFLSNEPEDLSEGKVLEEKFRRKLKTLATGQKPQTVVLAQNRDTKDDVEESVRLAIEKGIRSVAIITVGVHVPRTKELFNIFKKEEALPDDLKVDFLASEDILARTSKKYERRFQSVKKTPAYERTAVSERKKLKKLRNKGY